MVVDEGKEVGRVEGRGYMYQREVSRLRVQASVGGGGAREDGCCDDGRRRRVCLAPTVQVVM